MAQKSRNSVNARRGVSANLLLTLGIVVVAVAVIGGVLIANHSDGAAEGAGGVPEQLRASADRNTLTTASGNDVTVVEFLDYQCPACAAYYDNVTKRLAADYTGKITFVTRNFPLQVHPLARQAARAAEAAAKQGKYGEMYHQLYDNYRNWALAPDGKQVSADKEHATTVFDSYATTIGLNLDRFHTDMASSWVQQRIDADLAAGAKVGVTSTPTIFVDGKRFEPHGESFTDVDHELRTMIDEARR